MGSQPEESLCELCGHGGTEFAHVAYPTTCGPCVVRVARWVLASSTRSRREVWKIPVEAAAGVEVYSNPGAEAHIELSLDAMFRSVDDKLDRTTRTPDSAGLSHVGAAIACREVDWIDEALRQAAMAITVSESPAVWKKALTVLFEPGLLKVEGLGALKRLLFPS